MCDHASPAPQLLCVLTLADFLIPIISAMTASGITVIVTLRFTVASKRSDTIGTIARAHEEDIVRWTERRAAMLVQYDELLETHRKLQEVMSATQDQLAAVTRQLEETREELRAIQARITKTATRS